MLSIIFCATHGAVRANPILFLFWRWKGNSTQSYYYHQIRNMNMSLCSLIFCDFIMILPQFVNVDHRKSRFLFPPMMITSSNGSIIRDLALCDLVRGIHWSPVNSPHKGQWHRALMFSLICAWRNGWVKNREAGDLRRRRAHYDVTVMLPNGWAKNRDSSDLRRHRTHYDVTVM